ncbi:MAG: class I SAM-dependent methyltransferase [Patescibacteria group bacterium]
MEVTDTGNKNDDQQRPCPLCRGKSYLFHKDKFFLCRKCKGIFTASEYIPAPPEEKRRYESHNNDINDPRYRKFVSPITSAVMAGHSPKEKGLDFGCGTGPVISAVLDEKNYDIVQYDPYFADDPELLNKTYDYIVCCEVVEHFRDPGREFKKLKELLKNKGRLYIMTQLYEKDMDFAGWGYKDDPTHIFFYHRETWEFIKKEYGFSSLFIDGRLIILIT